MDKSLFYPAEEATRLPLSASLFAAGGEGPPREADLGALFSGGVRAHLSPHRPGLAFHQMGGRRVEAQPFCLQYWPAEETLRPPLLSPLYVDRVVAWSGSSWVAADWRQPSWVAADWRQKETYLLDGELNIISRFEGIYNWGSFLDENFLLLFQAGFRGGEIAIFDTARAAHERIVPAASRLWLDEFVPRPTAHRPLFRGAGRLSRGDIYLAVSEIDSNFQSRIICYTFGQGTPWREAKPLNFSDNSWDVLLEPDDGFLTGGGISLRRLEADGRGEETLPLASNGASLSPLGRIQGSSSRVLYLEQKEPGWRGPLLKHTAFHF